MKTFDAAMGKFDFSPVVVNIGFSKVNEGSTGLATDDVNLFIVDADYMMNDIPVAQAYYVAKQTRKDDVGNVGVRFMSKFFEKAALISELCYQDHNGVGLRPDNKDMSSRVGQLVGVYYLGEFGKSPSISADFSYLSENWDPMYEDWSPADIMNRLFPNTNAKVYGLNTEFQPYQGFSVKLRYAYLKLNENVPLFGSTVWGLYNTTEGNVLGQEMDVKLNYAFAENTDIGLDLGYFKPGNFFVDKPKAVQTIVSFKFKF
jgi:hypothetical protein